jgi:integrase
MFCGVDSGGDSRVSRDLYARGRVRQVVWMRCASWPTRGLGHSHLSSSAVGRGDVRGPQTRGELRALRASDVDLTKCVIRVERGFDDKDGVGETKGRTTRSVPIPSLLCQRLREHLMRTGRRGDELLFGASPSHPFSPTGVTARADKAWKGQERLTLHEARHCYASYMIAAGVNAKALSTYMGHASIAITSTPTGTCSRATRRKRPRCWMPIWTRSTG